MKCDPWTTLFLIIPEALAIYLPDQAVGISNSITARFLHTL